MHPQLFTFLRRIIKIAFLLAAFAASLYIFAALGLFAILAYCATGDEHLIGKSVLVPRPMWPGCGLLM